MNPARWVKCVCVLLLAAGLAVASVGSAPGASSSSVVGATVLSATNINVAGCASGVAGKTDFGPVTAGSLNVTSVDCSVQFGSSNDTARLRVAQSDGRGVGMFQPTRGALDTSFDTDGRATSATAPAAGLDSAWAVATQSDGRIITAGECDMGGATGTDACLARYNIDGSLDTTFDTDGRVTTATSPANGEDEAWGIAVQSDGRIITAGRCDMGGATGFDACLARYNSDGSLDTTFDTDGLVTTGAAPVEAAWAIAIQSDGRIITAGICDVGGNQDACLARYNIDGSLDTTFDGDGRVTTATAPASGEDEAWAVATQSDGRIITSGHCDMGGVTGYDACLARYNADGSLDTTFDGDGRVTTATAPTAGYDVAGAVAVQSDGRIITAGFCDMGGATGRDTCLARYNPDGSLDVSFDSDGRLTTATAPTTGTDEAYAVAVQSDGRIVTTGRCAMGAPTGQDACLARYTSDGTLDTSFDTDGRVTTATAPTNAYDMAYAIALQSDGRIITAGYCDMGGATGQDACLAQYDSAGSISQYADAVTDWDTSATSLFGACLVGVTGSTATWTTSAACPATDGPFWNAIAPTATQIAVANPLQTAATAQLRFGLRTAANQPPGAYIAPITFDVIAP